MRRLIYILAVFILIGGVILTAYAPDEISTVFIIVMEGIVFLGVLFGVFFQKLNSANNTCSYALA